MIRNALRNKKSDPVGLLQHAPVRLEGSMFGNLSRYYNTLKLPSFLLEIRQIELHNLGSYWVVVLSHIFHFLCI